MRNDPLDASVCRCDGSGWVTVTESYVLRHAPDLTVEQLAGKSPVEVDVLDAELRLRRIGLRNTVYPCRAHQPTAFFRWAGGHHEPDHDEQSCPDCRAAAIASATARRGSADRAHVDARRDLE